MGEMEPNQLECQARILPRAVNASSSPTVEKAMQLAREAYSPLLTLRSWIEKAPYTASVSSAASAAETSGENTGCSSVCIE